MGQKLKWWKYLQNTMSGVKMSIDGATTPQNGQVLARRASTCAKTLFKEGPGRDNIKVHV